MNYKYIFSILLALCTQQHYAAMMDSVNLDKSSNEYKVIAYQIFDLSACQMLGLVEKPPYQHFITILYKTERGKEQRTFGFNKNGSCVYVPKASGSSKVFSIEANENITTSDSAFTIPDALKNQLRRNRDRGGLASALLVDEENPLNGYIELKVNNVQR